MKNKKVILFLVTVMLMVMAFPTSAAAKGNTRSTKVRASCKLPDIAIEVTVPTATRAYLNPAKVSVRLNQTITDGQILSEPAYIENKSLVAVEVSVSVTGKVKTGSKMTFSPTSTTGSSSTAKDAFIYFERQSATDPETASWDSGYDADDHILVSTAKASKENIVTLGAVDEADRYGVFHLAGDCVTDPAAAWTSKDGFYADIVFTFLPTVR